MSETSVRLREWQTLGPDDPKAGLRGLRLDGDDARALAHRLARSGVVVEELYEGIRVQTMAHVGRVRVGGLTITIEPKLGGTKLLELFRYAYGLRDLRLFGSADFATEGWLLQDLLCEQLRAEVTKLADRGLNRRYVARAELLSSPRGRLDMNHLARRSGLQEGRVLCRHYQRSPDHLLNSILLTGVELASCVAEDQALRRTLRRLAKRLGDETRRVVLSATTLEAARRGLDRLNAAYEPALRLIELLYACDDVSLESDATTKLSGFLFDMNKFFQTLVDRFLKDNLDGFEVASERTTVGMMRYLPGANPRRRQPPRLRPDFQVLQSGKVVAILDAKYRDLWEHDLPREMLYQLAIYALSQPKGSTAVILYPTANASATESVIELATPARQETLGYVVLRPVILGELAIALREGDGSARARLARKLVWGRSGFRSGGSWASQAQEPSREELPLR